MSQRERLVSCEVGGVRGKETGSVGQSKSRRYKGAGEEHCPVSRGDGSDTVEALT